MVNVILSQVAIPDLVEMIAKEVVARINSDRPEVPSSTSENIRFIGDRALAAYLDCSIQTINKLKKSGKVPFHKYGRKYYYIQSEIDASLKGSVRK